VERDSRSPFLRGLDCLGSGVVVPLIVIALLALIVFNLIKLVSGR
jgi:hypothetical protein